MMDDIEKARLVLATITEKGMFILGKLRVYCSDLLTI